MRGFVEAPTSLAEFADFDRGSMPPRKTGAASSASSLEDLSPLSKSAMLDRFFRSGYAASMVDTIEKSLGDDTRVRNYVRRLIESSEVIGAKCAARHRYPLLPARRSICRETQNLTLLASQVLGAGPAHLLARADGVGCHRAEGAATGGRNRPAAGGAAREVVAAHTDLVAPRG